MRSKALSSGRASSASASMSSMKREIRSDTTLRNNRLWSGIEPIHGSAPDAGALGHSRHARRPQALRRELLTDSLDDEAGVSPMGRICGR